MSAVLVEIGFISNSNDNNLFDSNIDIIAEQIVKACLKEVNKTFNKPQPIVNKPVVEGVTYRVVCGSFKERANAEKRVKEIVANTGLSCFLLAEVIDGVSMYRVICGSFKDKFNAEKRVNEIRIKSGLTSFLIAVKI